MVLYLVNFLVQMVNNVMIYFKGHIDEKEEGKEGII